MGETKHKAADTVFLAFWLALLCAFPALKISSEITGHPRFRDPTAAENREPAPFPGFKAANPAMWCKALDDWYGDNFAFRAAIVGFYNDINLRLLQTPVAQQVPGSGGWIFRRALLDADPAQRGTWPEIEDCIGAFNATREFLDDWRTLFEGRVEWARAHGAAYIEVLAPVKAQIHGEHLPFQARGRHSSIGSLVEEALADSTARSNVVFLKHAMRNAAKDGTILFYREDHHPNPRGAHVLFAGIDAAVASLLGIECEPIPLLDEPPADADDPNGPPACWRSTLEDRLHVRNPSSQAVRNAALGIAEPGGRSYPGVPVFVTQPGEHRFLLVAHDSYLRYPLDSWHRKPPEHFALPFGPAFDRIAMIIFERFTTAILEKRLAAEIPDVIIEQFSESKLLFGPIPGSLDDTMRRAAAFSRATPSEECGVEGDYLVLAVFEDVAGKEGATAVLEDAKSGAPLSSLHVAAGKRRAVFFPSAHGAFPAGFTVRLDDATCSASRIEIRK